MEHTPGPWYTELVTITATGLKSTYVCARDNSHWPSGGRTIAEVGHWRDRVDPEADARLIAAAPALLEALEKVLRASHSPYFRSACQDIGEIARDAIDSASRAIRETK